MDVFLSWSGLTSKRVAELLRDWLPTVIQSLRPWISSRDIPTGQRWFDHISNTANTYRYGLFCLTPDNIDSKWIHFEAGAISNTQNESHIAGLLLQGLSPSQISGPLSQFQHVELSKDGMGKLLNDMNSIIEVGQLSAHILSSVFERAWPEFETEYRKTLATASVLIPVPARPAEDILKEILQITRDMRFESKKVPKHVERTLGFVEAQYRQMAEDMKKRGEGLPPAIKRPPIHAQTSIAYLDGTTIREEKPSENSKSDLYD